MNIIKKAMLLAVVPLFFACENEAYDTGEGSLSNMRADFVEAQTDGQAMITGVETDDGETLPFTRTVQAAWAEKPDTFYRALLYYNKVDKGDGRAKAEPLAMGQVLVPTPTDIAELKGDVKTDPVTLVSAWKSRNGKYLNLELSIKTGVVDGEYGTQTLGIINLGVETKADGTRTASLQLYHDQAGVPEYYSTTAYLSVAVARLPFTPAKGDEVSIEIVTYDGTITKTFDF